MDKKIILIGGALLIGFFLLSRRQTQVAGGGGAGGVPSGGIGTVMQPLAIVTPPPTTIDAPSYPVTYNIPAFAPPAPIPTSQFELVTPEEFFAPEPLPEPVQLTDAPTKKEAATQPVGILDAPIQPEVVAEVPLQEKIFPTKKQVVQRLIYGGF